MKIKDPTSKQVLDGAVYTVFALAVILAAVSQFKHSIDRYHAPPSDCFCPAVTLGEAVQR